jgi:hypothetical protein
MNVVMASTKQRLMVLALVAVSIATGASGATLYSQYGERTRLDRKLRQHAALTTHECSMLTESQNIAYAVQNPMHPDVPCTAGL